MNAHRDAFAAARSRLVNEIERLGVRDARVLEAMGTVPRETFVPQEERDSAYVDAPVPIGEGQTISQPFVVALMAEALQLTGTETVLEIGAGSGYAAAVLSLLAKQVYAVERVERLVAVARRNLRSAGFETVEVVHADGTRGLPEHAPYQAISVAAGGRTPPQPLLEQLAVGGRMVIPLGMSRESQTLTRYTRVSEREYHPEQLASVRFVPLLGAYGWASDR
jgi:protein-L-isoaspartate(D-aspartate) O-methyltransferase